MNFANVKAITIPEGNVKQIADGNGVVIWRKNLPFTLSNYRVRTYHDSGSSSAGTGSLNGSTFSLNSTGSAYAFVDFQNYDVTSNKGIRLAMSWSYKGYYYKTMYYGFKTSDGAWTDSSTNTGTSLTTTIYPATSSGSIYICVSSSNVGGSAMGGNATCTVTAVK